MQSQNLFNKAEALQEIKVEKAEEERREERIYNEIIIVDAYGEDEVKPNWFNYMQDTISFPFKAEVMIRKRNGDRVKQKVDVPGLFAKTTNSTYSLHWYTDSLYSLIHMKIR